MANFLAEAKKNNFVLPEYKNSNISVLKDIVNRKGNRTGDKKKKVFLVIDGMGYNLINNLLADSKSNALLNNSKLEKISTGYPSTTVSILASFLTGLTPAEHGMVGWEIYSKEIGMVITPYRDAPALSKEFKLSKVGIGTIRPDAKLLVKAAKKGRILILYDENIGMVTANQIQNCDYDFYAMYHDMLIKLRDAIKRGKYDLIYAYYPMLDHLEHKYGPSSEVVRNCLSSIFYEINRLLLPALQKNDYNLVITADHGQTAAKKFIKINGKSEIMKYLVGPPWGDARVIFMDAMHGKGEALRKSFEKNYGDKMLLFESDQLIRTGIFGKKKANEAIRYRFGSHIAIAKGNNVIDYEYPYEVPRHRVSKPGVHSGLSRDEMEVPLIVY